jgi:hypothetical protein
MKALRVWFYDPTADSEGLVNKLVARLDPPFCHVEVQFADECACSIYMGSAVVLRKRTFDSPNYTCLRLPCNNVQHTLAAGHAEHVHSRGLVFSSLQMTSCLLWTRASTNTTHTFCSKLVTEILQQAGLLEADIDAQSTSPSALHRLLAPLQEVARPPPRPVAVQRTMALDFR